MKGKNKLLLLRYAVTIAIGGLLAWLYLWLRDFGSIASKVDRYRLLCDAFTIPGVLLMLMTALIALSNEGALAGLSYFLGHSIKMLIGMGASKYERYADYVERKTANKTKGYSFIFYTGAAFFAVGMVFLALFYKYFKG